MLHLDPLKYNQPNN